MSSTKYVIIATAFDKKGNTIAQATNSYRKTHPLQAYFARLAGLPHKIYLHAEIACILAAQTQKIHKLIVIRRSSQGGYASAKPCPICMRAIRAFQIPTIIYSTEKGTFDVMEISYKKRNGKTNARRKS